MYDMFHDWVRLVYPEERWGWLFCTAEMSLLIQAASKIGFETEGFSISLCALYIKLGILKLFFLSSFSLDLYGY